VLEAMAAGAIPITTKFVALGIPELRLYPELLASNPSEWINKIENHIAGIYKLKYDIISKELSNIVKYKYSYEANMSILGKILKKLP